MSVEDEEVADAAAGDEAAFQRLVHAHQRAVFAFLYLMTGDRAAAQDMAQETFVAAFRGLRSFRGQSSVRTWLIGIARNLALKELRKTFRTAPPSEMDNLPALGAVDSAAVELRHDVDQALARLEPFRRSIFAMRVLQGLDYAQMSQLTGVREGRLRLEVFRARRQLMVMLAPYLEKK
jgi:RNA polymerase sigma-70 factor, ECF subfamily